MSTETQAKLLSSATVLTTLSDNDKIVAVTQAGNTGLVSKATLKNEMGLTEKQSTASRPMNQWIRVAEFPAGGSGAGIVFINQSYNNQHPAPLILLVGSGYYAKDSFITALTKHPQQFTKARLFRPVFDTPGYIDLLGSNTSTKDIVISSAFGINIQAVEPYVVTDETTGDRGFSIEVELGGG